jgi:hypothetical protein
MGYVARMIGRLGIGCEEERSGRGLLESSSLSLSEGTDENHDEHMIVDF